MEVIKFTREEFVEAVKQAEREWRESRDDLQEPCFGGELSDEAEELIVHAIVPEGASVKVITIPGRENVEHDSEA